MPLYPDEPRPLAAVHANAALCFMKLAEEADGKQREVLYAQALKRAMSPPRPTARTRKPTTDARSASRLLGRWRHQTNRGSSSKPARRADDAVKNDARRAALAARQAKVDAIARRKAEMLRTDDKRSKPPPPPPVSENTAPNPASTFITLDGGAASRTWAYSTRRRPRPVGWI